MMFQFHARSFLSTGLFFLCMLWTVLLCNAQFLIEKHIPENANFRSPLVLDLRALLVEKGKFTAKQVTNATIYSGETAASRPFTVKNGQIQLRRPLDRERICPTKQDNQQEFYISGRIPNQNVVDNSKCPSECCKIIHIEVSTDKTGLPHTFFVKIVIDDENDNAPRFPPVDTPYKYLKEDVLVGTRVDLPVAFDPDSSKFSVHKYSIRDWRTGNKAHFKLNSDPTTKRPYLTVSHELDRETNDVYAFTLVAEDGGPQPNSGSVDIQILVKDVNDNNPSFDKMTYSDMIPEHGPIKTLFRYQVTDGDEGENGQVKVNIRDPTGKAQRFFNVRDDSNGLGGGTLSLINEIDYENHGDLFKFKLVAQDHGKPSRSAVADVEIRVNNINDHGPIITFMNRGKKLDGNIQILEGTLRGTLIAQLHVSDRDSKLDDIKCKLVRESEHFQLEETRLDHPFFLYKQYSLQCNNNIDRETRERYTVVVECTDSNVDRQKAVNSTLRVTVLDINDNAPKFRQEIYMGRVSENVKGTEVLMPRMITITDADTGKNALVKFTLKDISDSVGDSDMFMIDKSGKLITKVALDYESKKNYNFFVIGEDLGSPSHSASATVSVAVIDKNDNQPEFTSSPYTFQVREDAEIGDFVGKITAHDKDTESENTKIQFQLRGRAEDVHLVNINRNTGVITVKRRLDAETKPTISFNVIAKNVANLVLPSGVGSQPISEATVVISVVNVNDNRPEFVPTLHDRTHVTFIWEHLGVDHPICESLPYQVIDKDNEASATECCDLKLDDDHDGMFSLMTDAQYVLCAMKKPPHLQSYKLSITATDRNGNKSQSAQMKFTVIIKSQPGKIFSGRNGDGKIDSNLGQENQHITIIAILASVAGIFCIILFVIIIALRRCSFENTDDDEKPQIHVVSSYAEQVGLHGEAAVKLQPEICTLLADNLGESLPDYYSEDELMCSAHNAYESSAGGQSQYRRKLRSVDNILPSRRFSRSCESMDKAWQAGSHIIEQQAVGRRQAPPAGPQYHTSGPSLRRQQLPPPGKMSEGTVPLYHTLHEEARPGDYQIIDPFSSIRFKPAEYTTAEGHNVVYAGYAGGGEGVKVEVETGADTYKIEDSTSKAGSKKSLRNAYFQTSFV